MFQAVGYFFIQINDVSKQRNVTSRFL